MASMRSGLLWELAVSILLGLAIGLIMTLVANGFVLGVEFGRTLRDSVSMAGFELAGKQYSLTPVFSLLLAALLVLRLKALFGVKAWAGPADSIYAAHNPGKPLDLKVGFGSTLVAFICASGGASVGQYGPLVHFGATTGAAIKRLLKSGIAQDVWLGSGVAAAISAGFNAPLAGVIFAHEAILRHFSLRAIVPIFIASVSANTFDHLIFPGTQATFQLRMAPPEVETIVPLLLLASPLLALLATWFMASIRALQRFSSRLDPNQLPAPLVAALLCGSAGVFLPEILGIGGFAMNGILAGNYSLAMLLLLLAGKFAVSALCLGFGLFGGIFSPSLFLGVAAGAVMGQVMMVLGYPELAEALSIAAMAAVSSAIVGAPVACIVIVMELTRSYEHAIVSMLAVIICNLVAHRLNKGSFFDRQLLDRGIDIHSGREAIMLAETGIRGFVEPAPLVLRPQSIGSAALQAMTNRRVTEACVCDESGILLGKLSLFEATAAQGHRIDGYFERDPLCLFADDSIAAAMAKAANFVGESMPVTERATGMLVGTITEGTLFHAVLSVQGDAKALESNASTPLPARRLQPLSAALNRKRLQWEPVMEITKVKGSSETMPDLSPNDEQAGFEIRNKLLVGGDAAVSGGSYARTALLRGLEQQMATAANPYKFGFVGSTDSHTGLSSVEEDDFQGKLVFDTLPEQRREMRGNFPASEMSASGLAGVWAESNTREAILQTFKRREVYATSGPRIALQVSAGFGGDSMVPMGGDLAAASAGQALQIRFEARKDPLGVDLERVQVIKGWLDAEGKAQETVIDVRLVPEGTADLSGVWTDPDFNPAQLAFYYVRALEVATPRHQVYDALALGMDTADMGLPLQLQERAWSSPVWYTPAP